MKSILVVDDNRDLADGLAMLLEDDFNVTVSYNGTDALSFLAVNDVDLVLLDVELPDINGIEIYCQIKERKPEVSILMMTGYRIEQLLCIAADNQRTRILRTSLSADGCMSDAKNFAITLVVDDVNTSATIEEDIVIQGKDVYVMNTHEDVREYIGGKKRRDILVLNLGKPVMCGLKVFHDLAASDVLAPLVIIVKDPCDGVRREDILYSLETTGCIFKPFDFQKLSNVIESELRLECP